MSGKPALCVLLLLLGCLTVALGGAIPKSDGKAGEEAETAKVQLPVLTPRESDDIVKELRKELKLDKPAMRPRTKAGEKKVGEVTPREACAIFVDRFYVRMSETRPRSYVAPPDLLHDWAEEALGEKGRSESRLIEMMESLCHVKDYTCLSYVEEHSETIERWWVGRGKERSPGSGIVPADLFIYLCVNHLRLACPRGRFGPNCDKCPGHPGPVCSSNGQCNGDGSREGDGSCACSPGYDGEVCNQCKTNFYEVPRDPNDPLAEYRAVKCAECNEACASCKGPTDADCITCSAGHQMAPNGTCIDLNECDDENHGCPVGTYCRNIKGSRACTVCDHACDISQGCTGGGPENCVACKPGYRRVEGRGCVVINNCHDNHDCASNEFCVHEGPAEHSCQACHPSCKACVDAGSRNCTSCADGYIRIDDGPADSPTIHCYDKNECNDFPCKFPEVCVNTEGSYKCKCAKNYKRDSETRACVKMTEEEIEVAAEKERLRKQREAEEQEASKTQKKQATGKGKGKHDEL